jgi:hypothetical protein
MEFISPLLMGKIVINNNVILDEPGIIFQEALSPSLSLWCTEYKITFRLLYSVECHYPFMPPNVSIISHVTGCRMDKNSTISKTKVCNLLVLFNGLVFSRHVL